MKNLKALTERRSELQQTMDSLVNAADTENRAMTEDEIARFDEAEKELRAIDETIAREERARAAGRRPAGSQTTEERAAAEEQAFADYIMGRISENRAGEQNMTMGNNGAIIHASIASRIIRAVKDRCPILQRATIYHVQGTLKVPVWGNADSHNITVGYQTEFTKITADSGKFTSVDLGGFLAGALTLIGQSLENNAAFNVVDFIIAQMAEAIANWLEGQLLTGTGNSAAQGALNTSSTVTAASATAITTDELIGLQAKVKQVYQKNACWIMHPDTFTAVKKLKDGNNRYLLQDDVTGEFPFRLLGKPVFLSDNMPTIAASAKTVLYGDCSGLSVNIRENISIRVLREKYADMHAIGVISWFEFDSRVTDNARLATLTQKAG